MSEYYTPEISEFHVGFRYEYQFDDLPWKQYTLPFYVYFENPPCPFGYYNEGQPMLSWRVKYLDVADIEELGWKKKLNFFGEVIFAHRSYTLKQLEGNIKNRIIITRADGEWTDTVFSGTIKNLNELQTIMKQIGI